MAEEGARPGTIIDLREMTLYCGGSPAAPIPAGPTINVPVRADGPFVMDRYGASLCQCFDAGMAARLAYIINDHAAAA